MSDSNKMIRVDASIVDAKYDAINEEVIVNVIVERKEPKEEIKKSVRIHKKAMQGYDDDAMKMFADSIMIRKKNCLPIQIELTESELES